MCIGVDTALNTIVDGIDKLRDTASSHNRAFLVETMGRESGYLAVQAGIIAGAEMVLIPEEPVVVAEVARTIENAYLRGKTHADCGGRRGRQGPTSTNWPARLMPWTSASPCA